MARRQRIDDLTSFAVPEQPALSPDGERIVYVLRTVDAEADRGVRALWTVGSRTGEPRRLTRGRSDSSPAWSPDGTRIDRKSTRLNSSHMPVSRMPSSA